LLRSLRRRGSEGDSQPGRQNLVILCSALRVDEDATGLGDLVHQLLASGSFLGVRVQCVTIKGVKALVSRRFDALGVGTEPR
jgi:hypothetical protein